VIDVESFPSDELGSMAEQCAGILQANVANDVDCNSVRFEIVSGQS
jgi:hypothetical protein